MASSPTPPTYVIDLDHAVIVDVEASRAIRQAEVGSARTMLDRTQERFGLWPARLPADSAYGSAENFAWLVHERGIEPHIPVFDKSQRSDGTFSRSDFRPAKRTPAIPVMPSSMGWRYAPQAERSRRDPSWRRTSRVIPAMSTRRSRCSRTPSRAAKMAAPPNSRSG